MKTSIIVQNLKCGGCAKTIMSKISEVENISDVLVDVESAMVSFISKNTYVALAVKDKLKALGYPSIDSKNSMAAKAISFVSCATGKISKL
jgi:copper chaperone CopZ